MIIPNKVKIGYKDYDVTLVDGKLVSSENEICYGLIEYDKASIKIAKENDIDQQKCALIHECLHGIDNLFETNLSEDQIRLISKGLYDFIKTNPSIFKNEY